MIVCEICGKRITKRNFWSHKHAPYIFKEEEKQ